MSGGPSRIPVLGPDIDDLDLDPGSPQKYMGLGFFAKQAAKGAPGVVALTDAATIATDASKGNVFAVTLGGNRTLGAPTSLKAGQRYAWVITQDGTGGRTLAYDALFAFDGGVTPGLFAAIGAVTVIHGVYDGTKVRVESTAERAVAQLDLILSGQTTAGLKNTAGYTAVLGSGLSGPASEWFIAFDAANGSRAYMVAGTGRHLELSGDGTGQVNLGCPPADPTTTKIGNSQISFYLNEGGNTLNAIVKYSNGTVKHITTPLALS